MSQSIMPDIIGSASNLIGGLIGKSGEEEQDNFAEDHARARTAMGTEALQALDNYYKTGSLGQYQAGQPYPGDLGAYDLSDVQKTSLGQLSGLVSGGLPDTYLKGRDVLTDYLEKDYDPYTSDLYKGFRTGAMRERDEATDQLRRDMAVTGDLYSTETARQSGLLGERTQQSLQNLLAALADQNVARRLGVAGDVTQLGFQEQDAAARNMGLGMSLGDIERQLKDQQAKDKYTDYKRQQAEWYDTVYAAKGVASQGAVSLGGTSAVSGGGTESPYAGLINSGLQLAGQGIAKVDWGGLIGNMFGGNKTTGTTGGNAVDLYGNQGAMNMFNSSGSSSAVDVYGNTGAMNLFNS